MATYNMEDGVNFKCKEESSWRQALRLILMVFNVCIYVKVPKNW